MIHQPIPVVSQCGAGAWLNGLASGNQRRLTGSSSASEVCLQRCCYTDPPLLNLVYLQLTQSVISRKSHHTVLMSHLPVLDVD